MPNHVINHLEIIGHEHHIKDVMKSLRSKEDPDVCFDFNSFLPMPEELRKVTSPARIVTKAELKKELKQMEEDPDNIFHRTHGITQEMSDDYIQRFGSNDWYDWALTNWGTKWGAYDQRLVSEEPDAEKPQYTRIKIEFQTAWSSSVHAIIQLSLQYPAFVFHLTYADEDCGSNTGRFKFKRGVEKDYRPKDGSNEAMEIYFECWGSEGWEQVDGKWKWGEDDYDDE